jgi:DNA-binding CsgD family transcriptional regulator
LATHRLLGEIETAAGRHANATAHLEDALELADACEAPFERALTLLALAEQHCAMNVPGEALSRLEEVRGICLSLDAAPTLTRVEALVKRLAIRHPTVTNSAGLTPRELDVLRLLAHHHTDKEIAKMLFVGPRTVETHVTNILEKLSVDNRREATSEALRLGLV